MAKRPITPAVAAAIGGLFAAAPALAVSDLAAVVSAPSEVAIGTPLEVTWGAQNVGDAVWFGGAVVDLFISIDPVLPNPKLQAPLVSQTVSAFPPWQPGARRTITSSFGGFPSLAAGVPAAGTRYFIVNVRDLDDNAANNTVIAPFTVRNPQLTVVRSGTGNGTVSSRTGEISCGDTCQALFPPGANVELDAMPAADSSFLGWSGDCTGSGPCSVTMNGDRQVGAEFALALSAEFDFSPAGPQVGQPVQFTDLSTGDPDSWTWEFGDGEVSAQQHPSHSYSFPGEFTARLTVSWAGVSDTTTRVVPVTETTALSTAALSLEVEAVREGGDSVTVAVTREGAASAAASVVLAIHDESARRGEDYEAPATALLEWAAGDESPRTVTITILDDDAIEEPEILGVELSAPQGLALGDPSGAVLLVLDDDFAVEPGEFATAGPAESPAVAAHVDGSRAYVWQLPDGEGNGAFARAFERNGASIGEPFALASDESADPRAPSVAWDDNGNLVVLWLQDGRRGGGYRELERRRRRERRPRRHVHSRGGAARSSCRGQRRRSRGVERQHQHGSGWRGSRDLARAGRPSRPLARSRTPARGRRLRDRRRRRCDRLEAGGRPLRDGRLRGGMARRCRRGPDSRASLRPARQPAERSVHGRVGPHGRQPRRGVGRRRRLRDRVGLHGHWRIARCLRPALRPRRPAPGGCLPRSPRTEGEQRRPRIDANSRETS